MFLCLCVYKKVTEKVYEKKKRKRKVFLEINDHTSLETANSFDAAAEFVSCTREKKKRKKTGLWRGTLSWLSFFFFFEAYLDSF